MEDEYFRVQAELGLAQLIDGLRLEDVESLKAGKGSWASDLPSITKRIENLQGTTSGAIYQTTL